MSQLVALVWRVLRSDDRCCDELQKVLSAPESAALLPTKKRGARGSSKNVTQRVPPDFNEARFDRFKITKANRKLMLEVSEPVSNTQLENVRELFRAFSIAPALQWSDPSASRVTQILQRIHYCDQVDRQCHALLIRARVQRWFEYVLLAHEHRIAERAARSQQWTGNVIEEMARLRSDMSNEARGDRVEYYLQMGEPLLWLVERYNWGVLAFPGINLTTGRLVFHSCAPFVQYNC